MMFHMEKQLLSAHEFGDMRLRYWKDGEDGVGMELIPAAVARWAPAEKNSQLEPLVQVKLAGEPYPGNFSQGRTMRSPQWKKTLQFKDQTVEEREGVKTIVTTLTGQEGCVFEHVLSGRGEGEALTCRVRVRNQGEKPVTLEMLSSFTLGGLSPFLKGDGAGGLTLHRRMSTWSAEGRLCSDPLERLNLETAWQFCPNGLRFGQVGSMPVNGYFPFAALEDTQTGVVWAVQVAAAASWQIEVYRWDEGVALSGGLADRELGHWSKTLQPGESFTTPEALLTVGAGDVSQISQRLVREVEKSLQVPPCEETLPILFNEFCTTWGEPDESLLAQIAQKLKGRGVEYFVIDAGWYADPVNGWGETTGDWIPSEKSFPHGLKAAADQIRSCGMQPGIWFELETVGRLARAFHLTEHLLTRDGVPITSGSRRFWDMNDPWVVEYLTQRVIGVLKDCGFAYIKIDYNDTIGIGCDCGDSLGEGLRRQVEGSLRFFERIREQTPGIVIESCSSGGHRLTIPFFLLSSMSSFSDAHDCAEIPIIAANLHDLVPPRQSQIWAILHSDQPVKNIYYKITATMLGRCCLSGDMLTLTQEQWRAAEQGMDFYRQAAPIIRDGVSKVHGPVVESYRHPRGWQAVERTGAGQTKLVVLHTFEGARGTLCLQLAEGYRLERLYARPGILVAFSGDRLLFAGLEDFDGAAVLLSAEG